MANYNAVSVTPTDRWLVGTGTKPDPADHVLHWLMDEKGNTFQSTGLAWLSKSVSGALNVHDAHIHHLPVNEFFHNHTGTQTTLTVAVAVGDTQITVASAAGLIVTDRLQIGDHVIETTFPQITAVAGLLLTLDRPSDLAYPIGTTVEEIDVNMAPVAGTLAAPISYKLIPDPDQVWHIQSFILGATFATAADDSKFGDIAALTNGVVLRGYNGAQDAYRTFTNWKANGDIKLDMYDVPYTDKAGAGLFGMNGNGTIHERTGAVPELSGNDGDYLEILIQDDISALTSLRLKGQGHIENL